MVRIIAAVVLLITLYICAAVTNKKEKREEELTFAYPHLDILECQAIGVCTR